MRWILLFAALSGCATLKGLVGPTTPYDATLCGTGAVPLACQKLSTVNVPEAGATFAQLVLTIAGPVLTKQANLKSCAFTAYPSSTPDRSIQVTATATCQLNKMPVEEQLTLTLVPVPSG